MREGCGTTTRDHEARGRPATEAELEQARKALAERDPGPDIRP